MKSKKKWCHINVNSETDEILANPIRKSSQLQLDANEVYTLDIDGVNSNLKDWRNIDKLSNSPKKTVIKSQNNFKRGKNSVRVSFEISKIKKMARNIFAKNNLNSMSTDHNPSSKIQADSSSIASASTNFTNAVLANTDDQGQRDDIWNEDYKEIDLDNDHVSAESKLILPSGGQSYNPSIEDHQKQILLVATQIDLEKMDKQEIDPENYLKPLTAKLKGLLPQIDCESLSFKTKQRIFFILSQNDLPNKLQLINECIADDGLESNEFSEAVVPALPRSKRSLKKKTQSDKNRKERSKLIQREELEKKRIKQLNRDIDNLEDIINQCKEEHRDKEEKRMRKKLIKSVFHAMKRKGLVKLKQSNKKYWIQSTKDIALSDELQLCLRRIKPINNVRAVHCNLIESGLINLPPEIDKQYESRVKYEACTKVNAIKLVDRSREFKNEVNKIKDSESPKISPSVSKKEITSLL